MSPVLRVAPLSGDDYGSPNSRNPSSSPMLSDSSGGEGFPAGACASKGTVPHSPDARPSALARSHVRFPSTGATFGDGVPTGTDGPAVGIGCPAGVAIGTRHRTPKRPRECDVSSPTNTVPSVAGVVPSPSFDAMTDDTPAGEALPVAEDMFPRARSASAPDVPFNHYVEPNNFEPATRQVVASASLVPGEGQSKVTAQAVSKKPKLAHHVECEDAELMVSADGGNSSFSSKSTSRE